MTVGLIILPTRVDGGTHVHAASDTVAEHNCTIAAEGFTLDQATMSFFVANGINVGDYDFAQGPLVVSATEEIHWTGTLTVPDGMFIGICTGGFDYSMGTLEFEGSGGVYLLNCQNTLTEHKDCQAFTDTDVMYITQDIVTMYEDWARAYGVTEPILNENLSFALFEDITFTTNILAPAEGYTRNFCKNGHTLTFGEGVDFSAFNGTVNILDCQNMPKLVHSCAVAHYSTDPVTQENIATYLQQMPALPVGTIVCVHLAEDIDYEAEVRLPDGVIVAVCLNGFTLSGVKVNDSASTVGGFFTYDCEQHTCRIAGQTQTATYTLTQDVVNFLEAAYELDPDFIEEYQHYALAGDVTLKSELWLADKGNSAIFCKNGYSINDEVGLNLSYGDVMYIDCNKTQMKDIVHESQMFGDSSFPMAQETFNDFNESLKPYLYSEKYSYGQYNYWSYLDSAQTVWYIDRTMSNRYITPMSSTNNKDYSFYFYAGSASIWDSVNYVYNTVYTYMGSCYYYSESENSTYGYTSYLLPAVAEDGSIYLALVNNSNITYDSELGAYFAKYTEAREVTTTLDDGSTQTDTVNVDVTVPVYFWEYNSGIGNLTVTIDGATYYLAADEQNGFHLDSVDNFTAEKLPSYYDWKYRYCSDGSAFLFHLSEDVSWEGTLTVPAGQILVIFTNGHTATGDYVHNDYGGVYIFNDDIHACPSAPEIPITISHDFIDLMLLMNGGGEIEMPARQYVALGEDITSIDPRFVLSSNTTLYICTNGYTISDDAIAQLTANGAGVELIDCDDLSHDSCGRIQNQNIQPVNQYLMVNFYQNSSGVFQLGAGTYYLYLTSDITLKKELVIPAGVELHICLNGYTIKSPKIITEGTSNYTPENECNGAIFVQSGAYLAVYDCSASGTGCITPDMEEMNGWGSLVAYAVANEGVFVLDSGNLLGMVSFINSGDAEINGGSVYGVLGAVAQGGSLTEDIGGGAASENPTLVVNNASINSALIGVIGQGGDVTLNNTELSAGVIGVGSDLDGSATTVGSEFVINGGSIAVGAVKLEEFMEMYETAGISMDPEVIEDLMGDIEAAENGEVIVDNDEIYGVVSNNNISISEDAQISIHPGAAENAQTSAELLLGEGASVTVTPSTSGATDNQITIAGNAGAVPSDQVGNLFITGEGEAFETDENGNVIIVDVTTTAKLYANSVSLNGILKLNLYFSLTESFINNADARVLVNFRGEVYELKVSQLWKSGSYNGITLNVSAKDYAEIVSVQFTDGTVVWDAEKTTSVSAYLDGIINDVNGIYDEYAENVATYTKNYCMAAATHFLGTDYTPTEDVASTMAAIGIEQFLEYQHVTSGSSEKITFAGASLFLEAGTKIRVYIQAKEGVDISTVDVYVDGVKKDATLYNASQRLYYVEVDNIAAKDLANPHVFEADGASLSYSALSYCYITLRTKDTQPVDLVNVCCSLFAYYESAVNYFNNK